MNRVLCCGVVTAFALFPLGCGSGENSARTNAFDASSASARPSSVASNAFTGELTGVKVGQYVTYTVTSGGSRAVKKVAVVAIDSGITWVEQWSGTGGRSRCVLLALDAHCQATRAYFLLKGDPAWTPIAVGDANDKPAHVGPSVFRDADETTSVPAGSFQCHKDEQTDGNTHELIERSWFSPAVPQLYRGGGWGGLVAEEVPGVKTELVSLGEDAKPSLPLPKVP